MQNDGAVNDAIDVEELRKALGGIRVDDPPSDNRGCVPIISEFNCILRRGRPQRRQQAQEYARADDQLAGESGARHKQWDPELFSEKIVGRY